MWATFLQKGLALSGCCCCTCECPPRRRCAAAISPASGSRPGWWRCRKRSYWRRPGSIINRHLYQINRTIMRASTDWICPILYLYVLWVALPLHMCAIISDKCFHRTRLAYIRIHPRYSIFFPYWPFVCACFPANSTPAPGRVCGLVTCSIPCMCIALWCAAARLWWYFASIFRILSVGINLLAAGCIAPCFALI